MTRRTLAAAALACAAAAAPPAEAHDRHGPRAYPYYYAPTPVFRPLPPPVPFYAPPPPVFYGPRYYGPAFPPPLPFHGQGFSFRLGLTPALPVPAAPPPVRCDPWGCW